MTEDDSATTKARQYIDQHPLGVLATADSHGLPQAAAIYLVADDDLNLYFVTKEETLKYRNLVANPHVAVVIYDAPNQSTIQATGTAKEIHDIDQFMDIFNQVLSINQRTTQSDRPPVSKLFAGDYRLFCITPTSLRLADYSKGDQGKYGEMFDVISSK